MKELTIEQKAKAYDEALEKARQLCAYPTSKPFISDLQDLFPELSESEDERIRKEIISFLTYYHTGHGNSVKYDDGWIAWLEKKGEQKSAEWSEEDSPYYDDICEILIIILHSESHNYNKDAIKKDLDWFESLKERVQPQPKQQWSEEDKRIKNNLLSELTNLSVRKLIEKETEKKYASWLKAIEERCAFKPSGEQVEAFEHFIRSIGESGYASPYDNTTKLLYSLLEQLKKLMEE